MGWVGRGTRGITRVIVFTALAGTTVVAFGAAEGSSASPPPSKRHPIFLACGTRQDPFPHPSSLRIRPASCIEGGNSSGSVGLVHMHWSHWGGRRVRGHGRAHYGAAYHAPR